MANTIGFQTVQAYLNGLAALSGTIASSPHKAFWRVDYETFRDGNVPHVKCHGLDVPIIRKDAADQSPFFLILTDPTGWCHFPQMPEGGPFITQDDLQITLADGTSVTGKQVRQDLATWLKNGFPKDPQPLP
jgi:hypothetical protein